MSPFFIFVVAVAIALNGCASKSVTVTRNEELHGVVGRRVVLVGTAVYSSSGAIVLGEGGCRILIEGKKYWPMCYYRQAVRVAGVLMEHHQPDLYFIRHAKLTLLGEFGSTDSQETQEIQDLLQASLVTNAINRGDWRSLRGLAKPGMKANEAITLWENAERSGHGFSVGKQVSIEKNAEFAGRRCTKYSFALENKDGRASPHRLQVVIREQAGRAKILDFWNFGW